MDNKELNKYSNKIFATACFVFILSVFMVISGFSLGLNIVLVIIQALFAIALLIYGIWILVKAKMFLLFLLAVVPFVHLAIQVSTSMNGTLCGVNNAPSDCVEENAREWLIGTVFAIIIEIVIFIIAKAKQRTKYKPFDINKKI